MIGKFITSDISRIVVMINQIVGRCPPVALHLSILNISITYQVIHPKTDEQRKRLQVAVKDILIFKSLDQEQREYVLDAMFEKAVGSFSPLDYPITRTTLTTLITN